MSLSSLFVQREVATIRQVEEALARQVIYGGDLATNLLEVARPDESVVAALVVEECRMAAAPTGVLPLPNDRVRALVPADLAAQRGIAPLDVRGGKLVLAVCEPLPADVEEQLSFALGMPLEQHVALAVRVRELISKTYGIPLERRMQRLLARLSGDAVASGSMPPLFAQPPAVQEPPRPPSAPPRRTTASGFPAVPPPAPEIPRPPSAPIAPGSTIPFEQASAPEPPVVERPPSTAPAAKLPPPQTPTPPPPSARTRTLLQREVTPAPRPIRRRRGPLTLEQASREIEEAPDRDTLLDLFFEFSRQFFDYAALFLVHGDLAEGRDAFGPGAPRDRVLGIGVPLDLPSVLATARERKKPITARPAKDGLDAVLLADLQRISKGPIVVVPIVVRARVVALLLGDFGEGGVDAGSAGEVASFAISTGHAFEKLIVRRKLSGFVAGNLASASGKVDAGRISSIPSKGAPPSQSQDAQTVAAPWLSEPQGTSGRFDASRSPMAASVQVPPQQPAPIAPGPATPRSAGIEEPSPPVPEPSPAPAVVEHRRVVEAPESPIADAPAAAEPPPSPPAAIAPAFGPSSSFPPPPANVLQVRRPAGPPIPREEPTSERRPDPRSEPAEEDAPQVQATEEEADASNDLVAAMNQAHHEEDLSNAAPNSLAYAAPPHRPASSRAFPVPPLPSVIVDNEQEVGQLVDRFLEQHDDAAEEALVHKGETAMPAIMARFPGPITVDRARFGAEGPPRASECGPLLRLVAAQRRVALPFVLARLEDGDAERRYWAAFLLVELQYVEAIAALVARLRDDQARVRRVARNALMTLARRFPEQVIDALAKAAGAPGAPPEQRVGMVEIVGEMRDARAVPALLRLLDAANAGARSDDPLPTAVRRALIVVTRQDFGTDARRWASWWEANQSRSRIEWLIDALDHELSDLRRAAGEELRSATREYFGFSHDLPPRERQRAQQRYRDWWVTEGRARFSTR